MGVIELLISAFGSSSDDESNTATNIPDLYREVLNCQRDASASQLRKSYHKRALKFHPDKQPANITKYDLDLATKRFQAVSAAYDILKDEEKRRVYDESGELDDEGLLLSNDSSDDHSTTY